MVLISFKLPTQIAALAIQCESAMYSRRERSPEAAPDPQPTLLHGRSGDCELRGIFSSCGSR